MAAGGGTHFHSSHFKITLPIFETFHSESVRKPRNTWTKCGTKSFSIKMVNSFKPSYGRALAAGAELLMDFFLLRQFVHFACHKSRVIFLMSSDLFLFRHCVPAYQNEMSICNASICTHGSIQFPMSNISAWCNGSRCRFIGNNVGPGPIKKLTQFFYVVSNKNRLSSKTCGGNKTVKKSRKILPMI